MSKLTPATFVLLFALLASPAAAEVYPSHQRGLSADTAYGHGDVDSVNFFNGNLTLNIPVGGSYPVGPALSYGLNLSYNSSAWDYDLPRTCKDGLGNIQHYSLPKADSADNAGFGWRLSMGRLLYGGILYESPDGGRHYFYNRLHPELGDGSSGFTLDGTYLRFRTPPSNQCAVASPCKVVEFTDGRIQEFSLFPGDDWRLRQTRDRFGNWVRVDYPTADTWQITDVHGRSHTVTFSGGKVTQVDLAAFGGATATWTFEYITRTIPRRDFLTDCPNVPETQTVSFLARIIMPGGHFYDMTYSENLLDSGAATSLRLPTGGKIEWDFNHYFFTSIQVPLGVEGLPWSSSAGVVERRSYLNATDSSPHGTWTYQSEEQGFGDAPGDLRSVPCWAQTTVTDPEGNATVHYFSTQKAVKGWSYALPFTFCHPETGYSTAAPFVSQRIYQGGPATGTLLREIQVEYESDGVHLLTVGQDKNHRLKRQLMVYHDDGGRFQETTYSDFDGMGNYRTATTTGDFFGGATKTATTRFNPARGAWVIDPDSGETSGDFNMPAASDPWIWNVFTQRTSQEGSSTTRSDYCFDSRGRLTWQRLLAGTSPGNHDLLTVFEEKGSSGRVAKEKLYGGDGWSAGFDNSYDPDLACSQMSLPSAEPEYQVNHDYQAGVLAFSAAVEPCNDNEIVVELLNQDVDGDTGLPAAIYDSAGVRMDLVYDAVGRLISERPQASAWRSYVFTLPTVGSPNAVSRYTIMACANGTTSCSANPLSWAESEYDGLGRRVVESIRYPSASGSTIESREFTYNALGWKLSESTWGDFSKKTQWLNHDRFGRPGLMLLPGKNPDTEYRYLGDRALLRKDRIVTGAGGAQTATHSAQLKDHFGRLIEVCEGMTNWWNGSCNTHVTGYSYDNQDRLTQVCVEPDFGCDQARNFVYDGRGFLLREKHPEVGPNGNSWTRFTYDSKGNVLSRRLDGDGGSFAVDFRYDRAGRLTRVSNGIAALKEFLYARTNSDGDLRRGKLVRAVRHNHVVTPPVDFVVSDTFEYRGLDGRVSDKWTAAGFGPGTRYFHSSQTYDPQGNVLTQNGPLCAGWPCQGEDPPRAITNGYTNGFLTSVAGFAPTINYQLGGALVHKVTSANGVTWEQLINAGDRQVRPSQISTLGVQGGQNWTTGTFDYDGVWNIHQMGNAGFKYDARDRLVEGQVDLGTSIVTQQAQFDNFGNLTGLTTAGAPFPIPVSGSTNRMISSGSTTVSYDVAGNLTDYQTDTEHLTWGWDPLSAMRTLRINNALRALYLYDANDDRIFTLRCPGNACGAGSALERWTLRGLGGEVLRAYEGPDTHGLAWKEDFVYRGPQLLATLRSGETLYVHPDHLGSTRQVTSATGAQVKRHHFYPFGQEVAAPDETDIPLKFTGHERDQNSGGRSTLDYMHARSCSPLWGRFLSVDPANSGQLTIPQSWNRYSYTSGNPLKYIDPDGRNVVWANPNPPDFDANSRNRAAFVEFMGKIPLVGRVHGWLIDTVILSQFMPASSAEYAANAQANAMAMMNPTGPAAGSNRALMQAAIQEVQEFAGSMMAKANLFERLAAGITEKTGGSWIAIREVATDGSQLFIGGRGEALIIDSQGRIFRGRLKESVIGEGSSLTVIWDRVRLIE